MTLLRPCPSFNMGILLFCLSLLVPSLDMTLIKAALATYEHILILP